MMGGDHSFENFSHHDMQEMRRALEVAMGYIFTPMKMSKRGRYEWGS